MRPLVLVHGSWLGGWCWRDVTEALQSAGCRVYAPSLTGLGDRAHLAGPEIDLRTHVEDVAGLLQYEDLRDAVLVGHSYAGLVVGGVASVARTRVGELVFLAANLPHDGQALLDEWSARGRAWLDNEVRTKGDGWRIPAPDDLTDLAPDCDDATLAWTRERLVAQPLGTFTVAARINQNTLDELPRTYISCSLDSSERPAVVSRERGWDLRTLETGHWPMLSRPSDLAELLRAIASA
ncbi:MAG: alpha/beta hydrolase [Candidatus Limnocylindrales bacterium]